MGYVSQTLRDSAKGQDCTLQFPGGVCNHDPATTVLAHLPSPVKGMGNKGDDFFAVFACSNCHERLDLHNVDQGCVVRALQRTQKYWFEQGILTIALADRVRVKPLSKGTSKSLPPKKLFGK